MDQLKNLGPKEKVLVFIPDSADHLKYCIGIIKKYPQQMICYITLYKSYDFLLKQFEKAHLKTENIFFIDCISSFIKEPQKVKNCEFVDAPYNLDAISEAIKGRLKKEYNLFIFDSLSALLSYGTAISAGTNRLARFINSFSDPFRNKDFRILFLCNNSDQKQMVIEESLSAFDKVLRLKSV